VTRDGANTESIEIVTAGQETGDEIDWAAMGQVEAVIAPGKCGRKNILVIADLFPKGIRVAGNRRTYTLGTDSL
jgi:hypothetical protein